MLGAIEPATGPPREVGVMLLVSAADQATATAVAKIANPLMLHLPTPDMDYLPSLAFAELACRDRARTRPTSSSSTTWSTWTTPTGMFRIDLPEAPDA